LSSDGKTLFFATIRDGSRKTDIYYATRIGRNDLSEAKPLPVPINTDSDDKAPFMHSDSRTLYFASKGHRGAGGYDIFYSRLKDDGSWTTPKNMGHPINTDQDEHGLIVSADGRTAYFASGRFKGVGKLDIYGFEMPEEARPDEILIVKGRVTNDEGKAVNDAKVEIKYMDSRETEIIEVDKQDGGYAAVVRLKTAGDVLITVKKEDHVFDSRAFTEEDAGKGGVVEADLEVKKIEVGKAYRVNDINYATSKAEITKASTYILENLITFLKENPKVKIAIHGHTDNVGSMEENMTLSKNRASNVMKYLTDRDIAQSRLSFDGFGPTKPISSNDTEAGRAKNRRTEFVIVSR
jgi:outer membrane protein OmpA-like peptidoglycan-associated protein